MKKFDICFTFYLEDHIDQSIFFEEQFKISFEKFFNKYIENPKSCLNCKCKKYECQLRNLLISNKEFSFLNEYSFYNLDIL